MESYLLGVAEAAARVRAGEISPLALVESCLARIRALEPALRAWVTVDAEGALAAADRLGRELTTGRVRGPLHGVPVGVKDLYDVAGLPTTAGSRILTGAVAARDAALVARLRQAGAVILGKTVTTEWAGSDAPPTRNPWDPTRTPGGSSSGSAAAVAARMCPAATGTQTAGSIVRPAAYNGVVGLKPTYGRLSRRGILPQSWAIDTPGVLTRSVEDAALLLEVLAGHDPEDPASSTSPVPPYRVHLGTLGGPPRLGLVRELVDDAAPEVRAHVEDVARRLAAAGAEVRPTPFPGDRGVVLAAHWTVMKVDFAAFHQARFATRASEYGPHVRGLIETGMLIPATAYVQALRIRRRFREAADALTRGVDGLLAPVTEAPAPRIETAARRAPALPRTGDHAFQMPWSFAGLPVVCLPSGLSGGGLPLAVQLIGASFAEERLLAVARWCERILATVLVPPLGWAEAVAASETTHRHEKEPP